jgi:hypothetical protein
MTCLVDVIAYVQQRQQHILPFEEMGNVLLDIMQGTLVCLDNHHIIVDVSQTVKRYLGFERVRCRFSIVRHDRHLRIFSAFQTELIGLSILLLIEDSERDIFSIIHN